MRIENGSGFDSSINMKIDGLDKERREFKLRIPTFELIGFGFYLGWIFSLFWSPSLFPKQQFPDLEIHLIRLTMTVGMFVAYIVFGAFASFLATKKGGVFLRVLALVCSPLCCFVGLLAIVDVVVAMVLWSVSGIGTSALLLVWSKKLVGLTKKQLVFSTAGAFFISSFLFLSMSFLDDTIASFAIATLPIVSVLIALLTNSTLISFSASQDAHPKDDQNKARSKTMGGARETLLGKTDEDEEETQSKKLSFMRTILLALAYSVGIGFVGACSTVAEYYPHNVLIIAAANGLAAVFAVYYLVKKPKDISIVMTEVFLPLMLIFIFVFSFSGYIGRLISFFVLFALLACYDVIATTSVSKSSSLFNENYVRTLAVGRVLNGVGCTIGWIVGTVLAFAPSQGNETRLFICFALVVFLVAVTSFAIFHPGPIPYFRNRQTAGEAQTYRFPDIESGDVVRAKVQVVADKYALTMRQGEVLCCLAQGRNAQYIAQKYVISNHTAKSHIYNIYMKLGVHSQQDLLDIIESVDMPRDMLFATGEEKPYQA